jgi:hypothetical protein
VQTALEKARRCATELNAFAAIDEDAIRFATESDRRPFYLVGYPAATLPLRRRQPPTQTAAIQQDSAQL